MKKVVFITGTRADYGKLKSIILKLQSKNKIKAHLYVTGMHNLKMYGATYDEIAKDKIKNVKRFQNQIPFDPMDKIFSKTSLQFSNYIRSVNPDMIIVHGDRIESLACAIIGLLNNVKVSAIAPKKYEIKIWFQLLFVFIFRMLKYIKASVNAASNIISNPSCLKFSFTSFSLNISLPFLLLCFVSFLSSFPSVPSFLPVLNPSFLFEERM